MSYPPAAPDSVPAPDTTTPLPAIDGPATIITVPAGPSWCQMPDRTKLYEYQYIEGGPGLSRNLMECGPVTVTTSLDNDTTTTLPEAPQATRTTVGVAETPTLPETGNETAGIAVLALLLVTFGMFLKRVAS
jgi:LPXTG-motif cell wall-anchored protein